MEKAIPLTLIVIMSLAVLLTDCGNSKQAENASKSSSAAQMEDTSSSKAKTSSALEASEPDIHRKSLMNPIPTQHRNQWK